MTRGRQRDLVLPVLTDASLVRLAKAMGVVTAAMLRKVYATGYLAGHADGLADQARRPLLVRRVVRRGRQ